MSKNSIKLALFTALVSSLGYAGTTVYAEGSVYTNRPSAEHIVLRIARQRMVNNARIECRNLGYNSEPVLISGTGSCSASYANHAWSAQCGAEFDCGQ